ncbi:hypothetical protein PR048_027478 [Dryococelus australis]|uniref:Uncharacterized protein n=1 Tax=Dryococelus australis TaxID=614101 RepID=A0ABQ9GFT2_9NEOP|nr:hypothetical protein PR048_027478 [Dryococelus australis]
MYPVSDMSTIPPGGAPTCSSCTILMRLKLIIDTTLDDSAPIADLQGNNTRIPYCQMWVNTGAAANEQTSDVRLYKGLWSLAHRLLNTRNFPIPTNEKRETIGRPNHDHAGNTARLARRSDKALGVRVSVARITHSLLDLGRAVSHSSGSERVKQGFRNRSFYREQRILVMSRVHRKASVASSLGIFQRSTSLRHDWSCEYLRVPPLFTDHEKKCNTCSSGELMRDVSGPTLGIRLEVHRTWRSPRWRARDCPKSRPEPGRTMVSASPRVHGGGWIITASRAGGRRELRRRWPPSGSSARQCGLPRRWRARSPCTAPASSGSGTCSSCHLGNNRNDTVGKFSLCVYDRGVLQMSDSYVRYCTYQGSMPGILGVFLSLVPVEQIIEVYGRLLHIVFDLRWLEFQVNHTLPVHFLDVVSVDDGILEAVQIHVGSLQPDADWSRSLVHHEVLDERRVDEIVKMPLGVPRWCSSQTTRFPSRRTVLDSRPGRFPDFRAWESCPDDTAGRRVYSGISPSLHPPLHSGAASPSSALKTSIDCYEPEIITRKRRICGKGAKPRLKSGMELSVQGQEARERYGRHSHELLAPHRSCAQGVCSVSVVTLNCSTCALVQCFTHSGDAALEVRDNVALSIRSLLCHVASDRRPPHSSQRHLNRVRLVECKCVARASIRRASCSDPCHDDASLECRNVCGCAKLKPPPPLPPHLSRITSVAA